MNFFLIYRVVLNEILNCYIYSLIQVAKIQSRRGNYLSSFFFFLIELCNTGNTFLPIIHYSVKTLEEGVSR